ncbi:hypothetical protein GCM10010435_25890 [Winogradskya consettensis]|uniref:Diguanylate cyclase/phosphodiesterase n=1 Tax=Winogradskya consettensis TaxID=113560 RepID=A0A919SA81_9ACTN|nr:bifunctional diguanylate cyclase/phosphodiesterase [Actinoplanes consettensis]GIM67970.1 hypothetical protein Aco04nite_08680 [Actinoplanes consettensis]
MRLRSAQRLFVAYAAASLVPIVVLAGVLSAALAREARDRGLSEGRAQAAVVARTAIEPLLDGEDLASGLSAGERDGLTRIAVSAVGGGSVVRLRILDSAGRMVFSPDGSGLGQAPDDEAREAAASGTDRAELTRLNTDSNDQEAVGQRVVEVYLPLMVRERQVGVLEIYLPYEPIDAAVSAGLRTVYGLLGVGLVLLWVALAGISASTMRRLRREAARNAYLADHDVLTGLPNRAQFHRRVQAALAEGRAGGTGTAVVLLDLDRFKEVNDTLGHDHGDLLLRSLSARLTENARSGDVVARLGGDEFALVLPSAGEDDVVALLDRLRGSIGADIVVGEIPLSVEASFGYVLAPADGDDADTVMRRADMAMYRAKDSRVGRARYDGVRDHYDAGQLALVVQLRDAIETGQLVLHYQPKTVISTGEVCAVEALVRWQHPERGMVPPDLFIPVAERTGLIELLTRWVLDAALTEVGGWDGALTVAVNISARNLAHLGFAAMVLETLDRTGMPADRLVLEITETALLAEPETVVAVLGRLTAAGVRISIDDFGVGQTSLGYLPSLPLDELKIDKSFVMDLVTNPSHRAIVRTCVDLGHNLGLRVVAEGVETTEILGFLGEAGCDIAQGYLLTRPLPPPELQRWLAGRRVGSSSPAPGAR